jgi:hypothetical protein
MVSYAIVLLEVLLCHYLRRDKNECLAFYGHELAGTVARFSRLMVQPRLFLFIWHFKLGGPASDMDLDALAVFVIAKQTMDEESILCIDDGSGNLRLKMLPAI